MGTKTVNLSNAGNISMTVVISITGTNPRDYGQTNNCGGSVAAGNSCSIFVTFKPTTTGTRSGTLSISDNAPNSPQTVALTGTGVLPAVTLTPPSLTFPAQLIFTTSKAQTATLKNTGLGILKITGATITPPFKFTSNCTATLNPGASCTLSVTFTPTTIGNSSGSISITDNAPQSPQKLTLSGTGTAVQLAPSALNFGNHAVGTTSTRKLITLSNKGSVVLNLSSIVITGLNAGDFNQINNCATSVPAGGSCQIGVNFTPSATGSRSASLSVSDDGGGSPQTAALSGTGT